MIDHYFWKTVNWNKRTISLNMCLAYHGIMLSIFSPTNYKAMWKIACTFDKFSLWASTLPSVSCSARDISLMPTSSNSYQSISASGKDPTERRTLIMETYPLSFLLSWGQQVASQAEGYMIFINSQSAIKMFTLSVISLSCYLFAHARGHSWLCKSMQRILSTSVMS